MKKIFLETHNINNLHSGFGQFNMHLLMAFYHIKESHLRFVVHAQKIRPLKKLFGDYFKYQYYYPFSRYPFAYKRKKYHVWHSMNQNTKCEPKRDVPYVLTIHDVNFMDEISSHPNHARNLRFKKKLDRASAITYISEYTKETTHRHFDVPKVPEYVIYNGNPVELVFDLSSYESPFYDGEGDYIFSIGNFLERKNFHLLVEMLPYLKDSKLIIAGDSSKPYGTKVKSTIEKLNLQDRVILTGKIDDKEKQFLLKNCKAFAFPSKREGFGLPPIEAMRFGKPIFLANNTSLPEIGGEYAFYWDNYDPKDMADGFLKGMNTYENNKLAYKKALVKRAKSFTWRAAAKQYIKVYKSLLES